MLAARMGLFGKRAPECDWCGRTIDGDGIKDGDLLLCSQACVDLKNTPAAAAARTVPDLRNPTLGLAASDLGLAALDLQQCDRIAASGATDEAALVRAQESYYACWRRLVAVRRLIASRSGDLREFDALLRGFLDNAEVVDVSQSSTRARRSPPRVSDDDRERMRRAHELLQRTVDQLGDE